MPSRGETHRWGAVFLILGVLCFGIQGHAQMRPLQSFSWDEKLAAALTDKLVESRGLEFRKLKVHGAELGQEWSLGHLGEALIWMGHLNREGTLSKSPSSYSTAPNSQSHSSQGSSIQSPSLQGSLIQGSLIQGSSSQAPLPQKPSSSTPSFRGKNSISARVFLKGECLGDVELAWQPSGDPLSYGVLALFLLLDRATLWPQWVMDRFPEGFAPQPRQDLLEVRWKKPPTTINTDGFPSFVVALLQEWETMSREENGHANSLVMVGSVTRYTDRVNNRYNFVIEGQFDGAEQITCRHWMMGPINPLASRPQRVKGRTFCQGSSGRPWFAAPAENEEGDPLSSHGAVEP